MCIILCASKDECIFSQMCQLIYKYTIFDKNIVAPFEIARERDFCFRDTHLVCSLSSLEAKI